MSGHVKRPWDLYLYGACLAGIALIIVGGVVVAVLS